MLWALSVQPYVGVTIFHKSCITKYLFHFGVNGRVCNLDSISNCPMPLFKARTAHNYYLNDMHSPVL